MTKEKKEEKTKNYFEVLNEINVSDKIEKKNGLSYLSWAWAWAEIKKRYPDVKKNVVKNEQGWLYHTDGKTCWVEVSVVINGIEETEYLPIMDFRNQAIPLERITSMNVNTTIQRALTKAIARHGLGLYIYAGEDLPEGEEKEEKTEKQIVEEEWRQSEEGKEWIEKNFKLIKEKIEACESEEQLKAVWKEKAVDIARLKRYAGIQYNLLNEAKEYMKNAFNQASEMDKVIDDL